jgi:cytochrome c oxidase cbb3-type subunit III
MMSPPLRIGIACALAFVLGVAIFHQVHASRLEAKLVRALPVDIDQDSELKRFAFSVAPAVYREHCASCHGSAFEGSRSRGAPSLNDQTWLYGSGSTTDIERTVLYGIRSGHPKSHSLIDMPGEGRTGHLTRQEVQDVVEYVLTISGQAHDEAGAARGRAIYTGPGMCYDCHGADALGISDYGAPALTGVGGSWVYGGDRDTLYKTVYDGRHGLCPAWIGKLSFVEIRALAIYLHDKAHHE